ncbi:hypothetical protein M427DRAFT_411409 [Gonapodya prolifera JEL478]|uniref:Protein kinase domain-containing protein n=1 Tax=Gonapodya prolifera (strain JEL478) TaxID=1344416 RepID=A0A139A5F0_GONPJ|nr:hypothetical protein M427DRAFT_411409 [Gonapodya prolifera JEL478]|eukprot:KXS11961.1 hypothetical protein M427DRAFT_411409 [Gonapodya prolifera JEL478]
MGACFSKSDEKPAQAVALPIRADISAASSSVAPDILRYYEIFKRAEFRAKVAAKLPYLWEIDKADLTFESTKIGQGGFATVIKGAWLEHIPVAVKIVNFNHDYDEKAFEREASLWFRFASPHVLNMYGIVKFDSELAFVCPMLENGSADKYLDTFHDVQQRREKALELVSFWPN